MRIQYLHAESLIIDYWHPAGLAAGILRIMGTGRILNAATLRADPNAKIITDEPEQVCLALGIAFPDPQVIQG